jgi:transglutaminase-like putative cysteine protease
MRYRVSHRTSYRYGSPIEDAYSVACLLPRSRQHQDVLSASIHTVPATNEFVETRDVFGNRIVQLGIHQRHDEFELIAESLVEVRPFEVPTTTATWEGVAEAARQLRGADAIQTGPYRASTPASRPEVRTGDLFELTGAVFQPGRPVVEALADLSRTIFETYAFDPAATDWATPLDTVLAQRRGVCQDFAHLAIAALRSVGVPASYVSGYIETDPPPGEEKSIGADASHAWCSAWTGPRADSGGWLDLDPTNDHVPPTRHVTVGWGRDYADVAPLRGVVLGPSADQVMDVAVDVARVDTGVTDPSAAPS